MPEVVAEVVGLRTARTLVPRGFSVSEERGLGVFAFSVLDVAFGPDLV